MPRIRHAAVTLVTIALLGACTSSDDDATPAPETPSAASTSEPERPPAEPPTLAERRADLVDRCLDTSALSSAQAVESRTAWICADVVVVVRDPALADIAAPLAAALGGPVVLDDAAGRRFVEELDAPTRLLVGDSEGDDLPAEPFELGMAAVELLEADEVVAALAPDIAGRAAAALLAARRGVPLVVLPSPLPPASARRLADLRVTLVTTGDQGTRTTGLLRDAGVTVVRQPGRDLDGLLASDLPPAAARAWLVPGADAGAVVDLVPLVALLGDGVLGAADDPRADTAGANRLRAALQAGAEPIVTKAAARDDLAWKLAVARNGLQAPGGGQLLEGKRFVAMYGTPGTGALGVLGEQSLDDTVTRITEIAAPYDDGTATVVPTFEIIVDVASASATADGDYSYGIDDELIRTWVDRAAQEGFQVILDVQPGRTDFLTHAKGLEEFLVQPHVGLALDPEWRLKPDQVHLRQIGSVTGTEINTVVDWLAGLVREHALPQKMLVLHQFKFSMITEFDVIRVPDELQVTLHMDGQGGLQSKYATFNSLFGTERPQQLGMDVGWKNFYDEDQPMATPEQVLALTPRPSLITFQ